MQTTTYPERLDTHPAANLEGAKPTGRYWISACATASVYEWKVAGEVYCVGHVAGHGYTCTKGGLEEFNPDLRPSRTAPARALHYSLHDFNCGCKYDR